MIDWKNDPTKSLCPNCGKPGPHFVPPSLGEVGFFTCEKEREKRSTD